MAWTCCPTAGNEASATTVAGQFGLAIAFGDGASATAQGGIGNVALADGTDALAKAGSTAAGASTSSFNFAEDIGNNTLPLSGDPAGAYAGGGSLIGSVDSGTLGSSNNTAIDIGDKTHQQPPGSIVNSGSFAGDSALIGYNNVAGNADTAYTFGNINGFGDGSAAVAGNDNSAYTNGTETGTNEGAFSGFGNFNSATADTNYTESGSGVSATFGNGNYAVVDGPANSTADVGGSSADLSSYNLGYVEDPFGSAADSATAGGHGLTTGGSDLAEVLFTHGDASAVGNLMYDIISLFGNSSGSF